MSIVFTTSMHAVIYCIKETKLNLSDTQYVKTTSLLRRPVVNSHLHKHQRPPESHLSISAATYLTPFSTYGSVSLSSPATAAGIFARLPLLYIHPLTEMMQGLERWLIRSDVPDRPHPGRRTAAVAGPRSARTELFLFAGSHADNLLGWSGGLSQGVGSRGVGKIAAASSYAQTQPLMMSIKYECLRKHAKRIKLSIAGYSLLISNFSRSWFLLSVLVENWQCNPIDRPLQIIAELFLFFKEGEY